MDASNAYNSVSRQYVWDIVKDVDPVLANWVDFLYSRPTRLDIDCETSIMMRRGWIQGYATSKDLYGTALWEVSKRTFLQVKRIQHDFRIFYDMRYIDDMRQAMNYKHCDLFLELVIKNFADAGITINKSKSLLALNSGNKTINAAVKQIVDKYGLEVDYNNNYVFLGLPHGTDQHTEDFMDKKIDDLWIVYRQLLHVKSNFIRFNSFIKLLEFNKFNYFLSLVPHGAWVAKLQKLHDQVVHEIRMGITPRAVMVPQIQMSQKAGGLGLRFPTSFKAASEIAALRNVRDFVDKYFLFAPSSYNFEINNNKADFSTSGAVVADWCHFDHDTDALPYINALDDGWRLYDCYLQQSIYDFNQFVGPQYQYDPLLQTSRKKLVQLMDKKLKDEFLALAEQSDQKLADIARIKCLSNNGALSWLNVPYNMNWSVEFTNQYLCLLLGLILGAPIVQNDYLCRGCDVVADKYGHHALSCPGRNGTQLFWRHDTLCDYLAQWMRQAHYEIEMEQRYISVDGRYQRSLERPGDIKVINFALQCDQPKDLYLDISVANIFAKSHLAVAQKRLGVARQVERRKFDKYGHRADIKGLGYEVLGGMSPNFKLILSEVSTQLENRSCVPREHWMHRLRAQMNARLMLCNVRMLLNSGICQFVEPVCFDFQDLIL